jgi:hypothetical protein
MDQENPHAAETVANTLMSAAPAKHPLNATLPTLSAAILALYALSATLFAGIVKPGYGLVSPILFWAGICALYCILKVTFLVQRRKCVRLVTIACWMNFLPLLLMALFLFVQTFAMSLFEFIWDALGCHAMLILLGFTLMGSILAVVGSFVFFVIGFVKGRRTGESLRSYGA